MFLGMIVYHRRKSISGLWRHCLDQFASGQYLGTFHTHRKTFLFNFSNQVAVSNITTSFRQVLFSFFSVFVFHSITRKAFTLAFAMIECCRLLLLTSKEPNESGID